MHKPETAAAHALGGERDIYTVSRLNREVRRLLETGLPVLWIEGEVSNLARPGSGHWYFSLKDASAQVRCAMFRQRNRLLPFSPANGDQVLARGRIGLYEPRGEYQFIVEHMEPAGEGALRQAFERLKRQLDAEGLFAAERKRAIPLLPRRIGVITSPTGAAVRDVLKVLKRRFPSIPVLVYPVPVQGEGAAGKIAQALGTAARRAECDVIILTRGGGSLEDLWSFNEAVVARAVYESPIPVVCGVGHEIDATIADLVADLRAPTPSAAAEMVTPDRDQWLAALAVLSKRAQSATGRLLEQMTGQAKNLQRRLSLLHPARELRQHSQRLDETEHRLALAMRRTQDATAADVSEQAAHLMRLSPLARIQGLGASNGNLARRLISGMQRRLDSLSARLRVNAGTLHAVSPLATLDRGYAIIQREANGEIVRRASQVAAEEVLTARLAEGRLRTRVIEIKKDDRK